LHRSELIEQFRGISLAACFAQQALVYLPDIGLVSRSLRTVATSLLGDASAMSGNIQDAQQAYTEAKQMGQAAGDIHLVIVVNSNLANVLIERGLLHQAARIYSETLQMTTRPDGQKSVIAGRVMLELSQVTYEWNNLEPAMQQVSHCIYTCRQWGNIDLQAIGCDAGTAGARSAPSGKGERSDTIAEQLANEHCLRPGIPSG
jgi:ATP/maltotriose-dependent transcriptional regulator MalT